ncbi:hypothetical protein Vretimale_6554 [Volvox reticuliferus]|uniref:Uncharacterized protein n=1 Tax=Volvox reticuliferus TaxID=1737510 RepID=A0A8J4FJP0_9CHLO|nr:hypothetical protein Vretifemale_7386 [Volvox reticuliferus]GIM01768.1 hypothetical protein Vretimale_6554 [Volvox reticuliferus]
MVRDVRRRIASQPGQLSRLSCRRPIYNIRYYIATMPSANAIYSRLHGLRHSVLCCSSSGFHNPDVREAAKRLSAIFYHEPGEGACPSAPHPTAAENLSQALEQPVSEKGPDLICAPSVIPPTPQLHDVPLWRADSVVLPGQQALLHVHTPHYVHMFDRLFASSSRGPWLFGHVHLPAGSRNLGAPEWALCTAGSRAPTVGVLMEVNRAVRLEDGKLMVLATALCRIKVRQCVLETPYSRASVEVYHDGELLESYHVTALQAALVTVTSGEAAAPAGSMHPALMTCVRDPAIQQLLHGTGCPDAAAPVGMAPRLDAAYAALRAAAIAVQAAATAVTWRWLGYEVFTARSAAWPGRCPVEGANPWDTRRLVTELVDHGVLSVVPFADGPVAGRWNLMALREAAAADAAAAASAVVAGCTGEAPESCFTDPGPSTLAGNDATGIDSETVERTTTGSVTGGKTAAGEIAAEGNLSLGNTVGFGWGPDEPPIGEKSNNEDYTRRTFGATSGGGEEGKADELTGHTVYDLLLLESRLWRELDMLAVLQARVHQQRLGLPLGLLQLRPSDELTVAQLEAAMPPSVACRRPSTTTTCGLAANSIGTGFENFSAPGVVTPFDRLADNASVAVGAVLANSSAEATREQQQRCTPQPRMHPASEGLDVYCHPDYPLERRIMRLSYAVAGIFIEAQDSASRQQLLETTSVRMRLQDVLRRAQKARSILAAMAAVKALRPGKREL